MDEGDSPTGPFDMAGARLLADQDLYAGRLVRDRSGAWSLMAFENRVVDGQFMGRITDPIGLVVDPTTGDLSLVRDKSR